jgi:hypothetical protein
MAGRGQGRVRLDTLFFHVKFQMTPAGGSAAQAGLQKFKLLARDLTLEPVANSRLYGRDFNQRGTRIRPDAGVFQRSLERPVRLAQR